ncbi:MAG: DNA polymerase III subunit beta [Muribaculaceae bacterium]|nr:DNA polymerase III subunit beta [Muribaculaceae bacterium]
MKFNVGSKALYSYVSAVSKVINTKNAMTVLNNFLLELKGETLTITASDIENRLVGQLAVSNAEGDGKYCVDARRLVELLKEMPDQGITFTINDQTLESEIAYSNGTFQFVALRGEEYPEPAKAEGDEEAQVEPIVLKMPAERIVTAIENTIFAASADDFRPQMMGILWDVKPDNLVFVTTDTRKLVRYIDKTVAAGKEGSFILPTKPAHILRAILHDDEEVEVTVGPKSASFKSPSMSLTSQLIKGRFPDYNRVIPPYNPYTLTVDRAAFISAVRRVGVFVDPSHGLIRFKITPDCIHMKTVDSNYNTKGQESVPCQFDGNELIIGFSAPYLIDIMNTLDSPELKISLSDQGRPGIIRPSEEQADSDILMLLMPMNVQEF